MAKKELIHVKINGKDREAPAEPRLLLVHFIREQLGLTGTHVGCDTSNCGACTVILNGRSMKSCTLFAVQADGGEIMTVEGLPLNGALHPLPVGSKFGGQDFEGNGPFELAHVLSEIDFSHPTRAEQFKNLVVAECASQH